MTELIVGRESGVDYPRLVVEKEGKVSYFGKAGSVPKSVSRRHCRIVIADNSRITLEDITSNNFLFINGVECKRKDNVSIDDTIELGPEKYRLDLEQLTKSLSANQAYNISALKEVYDKYQKEKFDMQVNQGKMNALSSLPGILSMGSVATAFLIPSLRAPMSIAAAVFAILFAFFRFKNASQQPLKTKKTEEDFRENYVCPNPSCRHFLGSTPYKELIKGKACPYCKSKFSE